MTTKAQFISQARAANPKPQFRNENGAQVELTDDEYEASVEAWAEMKLEQDAYVNEKQMALESARAKLAKLGLTDDELKALLGL